MRLLFIIPLASIRVFCVGKAIDLQIQNVSRTNENVSFLQFSIQFSKAKNSISLLKIIRRDEVGLYCFKSFFLVLVVSG